MWPMSAMKNFSIQALVTRDYGEMVIYSSLPIPHYQFRYSVGFSMKHMTLLALVTQFYCSHLYVALMSCQCRQRSISLESLRIISIFSDPLSGYNVLFGCKIK